MSCFLQRPRIWLSCLVAVIASAGSLSCAQQQSESKAETGNSKGQQAKHTNRLVDETSPYLLMHAHNPVDWHPWNAEALKKAKDENKVIFLSIGYSSCHWCHVMERESFLDEEIAKFMNEHFVCIKVDREERPDIDSIYMTSLRVYNQLVSRGGSGGWPLSMFLTPDAKPFFGGTYFPARDGDRGASTGFLTIVKRVNEAWDDRRDFILRDAERVTSLTRSELDGRRTGDGGDIKSSWIGDCKTSLYGRFDPEYGGFGFSQQNSQIPKFPEPSNLFFLIDYLRNVPDDEQAKLMLTKTLDRMSMGGIYDHIGGGFHRYSVDRYWKIPHFEKMLYDNGLLLSVYADAFQLTEQQRYRYVAEGIAKFALHELTDDQGGFYAALDAESENEEGKYYRWEKREIKDALSPDEYELFAKTYGIDGAPNFEGQYYAPQLSQSLDQIAGANSKSFEQLVGQLTPLHAKLFDVRSKRERPLTDTKILTSWNGLMIRGLADAGRILDRPQYTQAAIGAADFLWKNSYVDGRLRRTHTSGQSLLNGYLNDYAFFINGLIALHRATDDPIWINRANDLQKTQNKLYWDDSSGGFFFTSHDHESLLARAKQPTDSAIPSGNSVSATNLVYLASQLDEPNYQELAERTITSMSGLLDRFPTASPWILQSVRQLSESKK